MRTYLLFVYISSEIITPTLLIYPMLLPKLYQSLFHLYILQNETADEQYWTRIQKFNRQCDVTLLSYLGIPEKFWFLNEDNSNASESPGRIKVSEKKINKFVILSLLLK